MKNPSTISSGESDERAVSVTEWIRNNYQDHTTVDSLCDALDRTLAALATQPAESKACASAGVEREQLRAAQSANVMPQIGPLLDAWEGLDNDTKSILREQSPGLDRCIRSINRAMEGAALASPAPSVGEPVHVQRAAEVNPVRPFGRDPVNFLRDLATPPAATEAPSEQEEKLWGEFLADLEQIRPIGKRHAGMLKAVKKYRLLGEG